jgi:hypothetical protein
VNAEWPARFHTGSILDHELESSVVEIYYFLLKTVLGTYYSRIAHFTHHVSELLSISFMCMVHIIYKARLSQTVIAGGDRECGHYWFMLENENLLICLGYLFFLNKQIFRMPDGFILIHFPSIEKSVIAKLHFVFKKKPT